MRVLCVGDVVGIPGRDYLKATLPALKRQQKVDICVVNGENAAATNGISKNALEALFAAGADCVTTGNHAFGRRDALGLFDAQEFLLRPANFGNRLPGHGFCVVDKGRFRLAVVNLIGRAFLPPCHNPFDTIDEILAKEELQGLPVLVDFHAEATGEKRALGFYLDGKVSALFGTHTHVQTADGQVLPKGTGYLTDAGMTGPIDSVLGVQKEIIVDKMRDNFSDRFVVANGPCALNGVLFDIDPATCKTTGVELVQA